MHTSREYKLAQELVQLANDVSLKILDCNNKNIKVDDQDMYRMRSARASLVTVQESLNKRIAKGH